jgi:hypothetical protein
VTDGKAQPTVAPVEACGDDYRDPLTRVIVAFLRDIGLEVRPGTVVDDTFLPGIGMARGTLIVDEDRLGHPGDLLHEAGHLAVAPPSRRRTMDGDAGLEDENQKAAEEMMAIAWSWAAALHLNLTPEVVFHAEGYRGGSKAILTAFRDGHYIGVPALDAFGMTVDPGRAKRQRLYVPVFPQMTRWLREA